MTQRRKTTCIECGKELVINIWADRSVGIPFDFDVLEVSSCTCDFDDDELVARIYVDLADKFGGEVW